MSTLAQDELEKRVDAKVTAFVACVLSNLTDEDARRVDFRVPPGVCAKHMSPYVRETARARIAAHFPRFDVRVDNDGEVFLTRAEPRWPWQK